MANGQISFHGNLRRTADDGYPVLRGECRMVSSIRMPPGWRKLRSFSEMAQATADFNEGREADGGHVYFLASESGPIKIGYSTKLHARIRALKNSSPVPLTLLASVPGDRADEARWHRKFWRHHLHGEWFARNPELLAEIATLTEGAAA
ncbi:GIY-YIG nuclease family protein [Sphingomonas sp.]|uniref:GIY-YIG nuclease family protein n=1 Tax=Sphingomonas sp. TaxID=28214 RepID=UPI0025E85DB3|nr:GIY-YIG nuclease family protein [Sphingomonas sp.]